MRLLLLCLFFSGVILIVLNELLAARPRAVEYRYLPRDLDTYLRDEPYASVTYQAMFSEPDLRVF